MTRLDADIDIQEVKMGTMQADHNLSGQKAPIMKEDTVDRLDPTATTMAAPTLQAMGTNLTGPDIPAQLPSRITPTAKVSTQFKETSNPTKR